MMYIGSFMAIHDTEYNDAKTAIVAGELDWKYNVPPGQKATWMKRAGLVQPQPDRLRNLHSED